MVVTSRPRPTLAQWLRDAYADPAAGCPPPEAFLAEEIDALAAEDRRRLEAHAERCPACSAERALAVAFDTGAEAASGPDVDWVVARLRGGRADGTTPAPRLVGPPARRGWSTWGRLAAAAVLVLAAGLAFRQLYPTVPPLPSPRQGSGSTGVLRGGEVELVVPVGEVASTPRELRWRAFPGAAGYHVRLVIVDGTTLWETRVSRPRAGLPADVAARLHPGVSYHWEVEALGPGGSILGNSGLLSFRVRPPPEVP